MRSRPTTDTPSPDNADRGNAAATSLPIGLTVATGFGFLLVQLDVSIVNVALAAMGEALRTRVAGLQWIVDAYTLSFAAFLLLAGSLGDRIGARRVFLAGFALFLAASLACGLAPDAIVLIAARAVQGFGAALMVPSSLALLNHACAGDAARRHRAVALWTAAGSVGLALGPVIGGFLIEALGWRAIFLVNLPVGALGVWLTLRRVPKIPGAGGRFDWAGQSLAVIGLFSLVGASIEAGTDGWRSPVVLGGLASAALALTALVAVEARAKIPLLPLGFFREPAFPAALVVGAAINFTLYGTLFLVSLVLQQTRGEGPAAAGWIFLPATVAIGAANVLAGQIGDRLGTRRLLVAGLAIAACGFALLRGLGSETPAPTIVVGLMLMGGGIGAAVPAMTSSLLAAVPREHGGVASGVLNTVRQAAGAMGVGIFGGLTGDGGASAALDIAIIIMLVGIAAALATGGRRPIWRDI